MRRGRFVALLFAGAVSLGLAGCTSFSPVYGDMAGAQAQNIRFNFAPPSGRLSQIVAQRLGVTFSQVAGPDDPVLTITASKVGQPGVLSDAFDARKPLSIRVQATVTIRKGDEVLFEARRFADTSYQSLGQLLAQNTAATAAEEAAARSVAESLRLAILAGYRPAP